MPDTPLNPDALEAAKNMFIFMCADGYTPKAEDAAESLVSAYLAVARSEVQENSKPNQNFEVVTSAEELDALHEGTILRDSYGLALHKRTANWWVTNGDNNLTSEDLADEIADTAHTYTVLYRSEVNDA